MGFGAAARGHRGELPERARDVAAAERVGTRQQRVVPGGPQQRVADDRLSRFRNGVLERPSINAPKAAIYGAGGRSVATPAVWRNRPGRENVTARAARQLSGRGVPKA
jgi:hypothetical protein